MGNMSNMNCNQHVVGIFATVVAITVSFTPISMFIFMIQSHKNHKLNIKAIDNSLNLRNNSYNKIKTEMWTMRIITIIAKCWYFGYKSSKTWMNENINDTHDGSIDECYLYSGCGTIQMQLRKLNKELMQAKQKLMMMLEYQFNQSNYSSLLFRIRFPSFVSLVVIVIYQCTQI